jgi:ABC-type nitrate/sulfonate/bicarbonate transport system ATPase subunit
MSQGAVVSPPAAAGGIVCDQVSHAFDRPKAPPLAVFTDVSLDIATRSFVSLLGPSGCGKTTLLRVIHGLIRPAAGRVLIGGKVVAGPAADRAMVFQEHNLLPWKSAIDNVRFGMKLARVPRAEQAARAAQALRLVGLQGFADSLPSQLSGGMKQRVGLARALAIQPRVLLMDEPFGALDAQTREVMQEELLRLWEDDRKTVVFVTHSIDESILLSDEIVVMTQRPGRIRCVMPVPLPRPRSVHDRDGQVWSSLRRELWDMLKPENAIA